MHSEPGCRLSVPQKKSQCYCVSVSGRLPYLAKVPHIKQVKGVEQVAFLHSKFLAARHQESPDILQAQELCWEDSRETSVSEAPITVQAASHVRMNYYLPFQKLILSCISVLLAFSNAV